MIDRSRFQFKNDGNHQYLTARPDGVDLIHYQVKMLENNPIVNLLPLRTAEHNGETTLFYEVTSCVPLSQLLERKQLDRKACCALLRSLYDTCRELPEYQLPAVGLQLDDAFIFVRPGDFSVRFVYLPIQQAGDLGEMLRGSLQHLVMDGHLDRQDSELVSQMVTLFNQPVLDLAQLKAFCDRLSSDSAKPAPPAEPPRPHAPRPPLPHFDPEKFGHPPASQSPKPPTGRVPPVPPSPRTSAAPPTQPASTASPVPPVAPSPPKNTGRRIVFALSQIVLLGAVALLYLNGLLNEKNGALSLTSVAGAVLACAGIDFLLFRRLFSGSKTPKQPKKAKKAKQPVSASAAPAVLPKMPPVAGAQPPQRPPIPAERPMSKPAPQPSAVPPAAMRPAEPPLAAPQSDSYEETVLMEEGFAIQPRLTRYENGLAQHIPLPQGTLVIGKQKDQVDLVLRSARVSHIHAEICYQDGGYVLMDCNSKNGTYLNGSATRLDGYAPYPLQNGDVIRVADVELTFEC